jgi:hypothetical protein
VSGGSGSTPRSGSRSGSTGSPGSAVARPRRFGRQQGFPDVGRTLPAATLTVVTVVAGAATSWFVIGLSGWLVIALLLVLSAAAVPRGPFTAILSVILAITFVLNGNAGYSGRFVLLLVVVHFLFAVGSLSAWLPRRARVQLVVLRPPLLRYIVVQLVAQVVAFVILTYVVPVGAFASTDFVWLGIVGAVAALALALLVVVPVLLRPSR